MVILPSLSDARLCRENAPPGGKRAGRGDRVAARQSDVNEQDSPAAPSEDDAATRRSGIDIRTGRTASQRLPLVDPVEPPPAKYPNRLGDLSALRQSRSPTITIRMPPPTPPEAIWPIMEPISKPPAPAASAPPPRN